MGVAALADSLIPEFFAPNEGEVKVVTGIFKGGTLEVGPGGLGTAYVIGVQVDRDTRTIAESGLEPQPALEGPSVRCDRRQSCQETLEGGLATHHVRGRRHLTGPLAQPGLYSGSEGAWRGVVTHAGALPRALVRQSAGPEPSGASVPCATPWERRVPSRQRVPLLR
jgi:hypothetical protein